MEKEKYCLQCGKELTKFQKKFCSSSCSAKYNNKGRKLSEETKQKISETLKKSENNNDKYQFCLVCGKELKNWQTKFCSQNCFQKYIFNKRVENWKQNPESFNSKEISSVIKRFLMDKYENKCQICGWGEINKTTGNVPLEVHHIDGDCTNNVENNLQLLCPNCHSLTPNHGSLNKNSKRYKKK